MTVVLNREELAWAAGFFDGEGSIVLLTPSKVRPARLAKTLRLTITQAADPFVLHRFDRATGGFGLIYGPIPRGEHKPQWTYNLHRFEHVQAVIAAMWHWLSPTKREQARATLVTWLGQNHHAGPLRRTHCPRGHELTVQNSYVIRGTGCRRCRICHNAYQRAYKQRRRAEA